MNKLVLTVLTLLAIFVASQREAEDDMALFQKLQVPNTLSEILQLQYGEEATQTEFIFSSKDKSTKADIKKFKQQKVKKFTVTETIATYLASDVYSDEPTKQIPKGWKVKKNFEKASMKATVYVNKKNPKWLAVAFRGTEMSVKDWGYNADIGLDPFTYKNKHYGVVYKGFYREYLFIRKRLNKYLKKLKPKKIVFTGHSQGGAQAYIGAMDAVIRLPKSLKVSLVSFASPRVGDKAFNDYLNKKLRRNTKVETVILDTVDNEVMPDVVTVLPPAMNLHASYKQLVQLPYNAYRCRSYFFCPLKFAQLHSMSVYIKILKDKGALRKV